MRRARVAAELTIPALLPPEGADENTLLPSPYQALGAKGVNNLASKLLLTLFPPGQTFFRMRVADEILDQFPEEARVDIEEALRKLENSALRRIENSNMRSVLFNAIRHLIVTGDALVITPRNDPARMFDISQYVVMRDAAGTIVKAVIKEGVHPSTLDPEVAEACQVDTTKPDPRMGENKVCIYTQIELKDGLIHYWQEINDIEVPDSRGRTKPDDSPFIFLRWSATDGSYGRSHVDEYIGDLRSAEALSKAIVGFAAVAAKVVILLNPNSTVDEDELVTSTSGDIVHGNREDVGFLQLEKYADFQVAKGVLDELTLRLSQAFLIQAGTVRDAERVTAEEIRALAQELEDTLGGVYTVLASDLQLAVINRQIAHMKAEGDWPKFPTVSNKPAVTPVIVTGFDALGRSHDLNRLRAYLADFAAVAGPDAISREFNLAAVAKALGTGHNVEVAALLKTEEQKQIEQQQQMAMMAAEKAAGPVAGAVAKGVAEGGDNANP